MSASAGVSPVAPVIVVGIDGSPQASAAALWAGDAAVRRHAELRLVHGCGLPVGEFNGPMVDADPRHEAARLRGELLLEEARVALSQAFPELVVTTDLRSERATVLLLEHAGRDLMTVVGAHRSNRGLEMLLGSVSYDVATLAPGPVVVIRSTQSTSAPDPGRPLVVGIDGSPGSDEALSFAIEEASIRKVALVAVRSWASHPGDSYVTPFLSATRVRAIEQEQERRVVDQVYRWSEKYPDVPVRTVLLQGRASKTLLDFYDRSVDGVDAPALLVVGSRGRGELAGLLLGSTSQMLAAHSTGPLCIVHPRT